MVFSSAIFLFIFLPVIFGLSLLPFPIRVKNGLLVAASLVFYAFGEPVYVFLMIASTLVNYIFGRLLGGSRQNQTRTGRRVLLWTAVGINLFILGVFKYAAFMVTTWNSIFRTGYHIPAIALPIGISFFTFQALSYVVDVYRDRDTVQKSFWKLLLYISFFPQLIAGPIVRYHDVAVQLEHRVMAADGIVSGIQRFIKGLFKKLWIANSMGVIADAVYAADIASYNALVAWLGAICYTLQIYYDFSGYSDMAIGLAAMFGFEFRENFEHPYRSLDIREFWRRWHISLSGWFREYVYIPLGGNRNGKVKTERNKLIVFLLTGIWHGADWTFVLWGLIHGIMVVLEDTVLPIRKCRSKVIRNLYTWLVVVVAFVFFRADGIREAGQMIRMMFTGFCMNRASVCFLMEQVSAYHVSIGLFAILFSYPVSQKIGQRVRGHQGHYECVLAVGSICMLVLCMLNLASASYNPFIYFRF
ncbi:MAG: MBOAT family protein [Lachnospiraceae bacterium]|nr:MBOAT family protein [Lachnospiraceae bacterium]